MAYAYPTLLSWQLAEGVAGFNDSLERSNCTDVHESGIGGYGNKTANHPPNNWPRRGDIERPRGNAIEEAIRIKKEEKKRMKIEEARLKNREMAIRMNTEVVTNGLGGHLRYQKDGQLYRKV